MYRCGQWGHPSGSASKRSERVFCRKHGLFPGFPFDGSPHEDFVHSQSWSDNRPRTLRSLHPQMQRRDWNCQITVSEITKHLLHDCEFWIVCKTLTAKQLPGLVAVMAYIHQAPKHALIQILDTSRLVFGLFGESQLRFHWEGYRSTNWLSILHLKPI